MYHGVVLRDASERGRTAAMANSKKAMTIAKWPVMTKYKYVRKKKAMRWGDGVDMKNRRFLRLTSFGFVLCHRIAVLRGIIPTHPPTAL